MYHIYRTWINTAFWKQEVWHDIVLFKYDSSSCIQYVAHYQKGKANSVSEISDMLFQFLLSVWHAHSGLFDTSGILHIWRWSDYKGNCSLRTILQNKDIEY